MSKSTADLFPVTESKPARRAAPKWHPRRSHGFAAALAVIVEAGKQSVGSGVLPPFTLTGAPAPRMGHPRPARSVLTVRAVGAAVSTVTPPPAVETPSTPLVIRAAPQPAVTTIQARPQPHPQPQTQCETARCPRCGLEGEVANLFGYRTVDGKRRAQSWCRDCRRGPRAQPASRLVAEAEQFARRRLRDSQLDDLPLWSAPEED